MSEPTLDSNKRTWSYHREEYTPKVNEWTMPCWVMILLSIQAGALTIFLLKAVSGLIPETPTKVVHLAGEDDSQ